MRFPTSQKLPNIFFGLFSGSGCGYKVLLFGEVNVFFVLFFFISLFFHVSLQRLHSERISPLL